MKILKKSKKLITHDGSFHADDIFACATLSILLKKKGEKFKITRTERRQLKKAGDFVFDTGGIYDPENNRFDHHQSGGAGKRENNIPYSSFGLVWKKFGEEICESKEVAEKIDKKLVQQIDADDNGVDICKSNFGNVLPYNITTLFFSFRPSALEKMNKDKEFFKLVEWAIIILKREIKKSTDEIEIRKIIRDFYYKSKDKRLVIIDKPKVAREEIWDALRDFKEPLFAVYGEKEDWRVVAIRPDQSSYGNKKDLPKNWAGLRDEELQKITGVSDAIFCHNNLFLAGAKSKDGAIKLAKIALES